MFDDIDNSPEVTEQIESQETEQTLEQTIEQKTGPAESFRQMRDSKEKAQRERDEAYRLLKQYEIKQEQQVQQPQDEELDIISDQYIEGRHLSKVDKKVRELEKQLKQYQQQSSQQSVESRVMSQYPDFDKVVSEDNIEQLKNDFPELAQTLHSSTDFYSKAISTYKLIKKLGISPDNTYENEKAIVQKNASKPKSLGSIAPQQGDSPLSKANAFQNGLTDDLKSQLHKEMMLAIKQGR
jgi:hypothetical protein